MMRTDSVYFQYKLLWLLHTICVLYACGSSAGRKMAGGQDEIYRHIAVMEGNKDRGYIPSDGSGVTIGMGIDMLHQTRAKMEAKGIPDSIITKCEPYFGLNKAGVEAAGLNPKDLQLTAAELVTLNTPYIAEARAVAEEYGTQMTEKGRACLASLRHWAGRLGNTNPGKLARQLPDGTVVNYVWNAIKDKNGTTNDLLEALRDTLKTYDRSKTPLNMQTIEREIEYLSS